MFSLRQINRLEREFLGALQYNMYISSSLYARYYFTLRTMREVGPPRPVPRSSKLPAAAIQQQRLAAARRNQPPIMSRPPLQRSVTTFDNTMSV
jgi:hypothetical protein